MKTLMLPFLYLKNTFFSFSKFPPFIIENPWGKEGEGNKKKEGSSPPKNNDSKNNPPHLDDVIDFVQERVKKTFKKSQGGGGDKKMDLSPSLIALICLGGIVLWGATGFFRVQEGELAVVTRFGELIRISSAGLRYHFPSPIENVIITKVAAVNTIHGGLGNSKGETDNSSEQTLILTGDENMVHTDYTVLWKIKDVKEFLFMARQPEMTIKIAAESVIREVVGQTIARAALTEGRDSIGSKAQILLQKLMDQYKLGVQIVSIQLQNVAPPRDVIASFNGLQASLTDADRLSNEAEAYRNDIIPRARGEATQIQQEAEGYRQTKIAQAEGESSRFSQVYGAYKKSPHISGTRYYMDAMQHVMTRVQKIVIDPKVGNNILPYLPLTEAVKAPPQK